ncbi:MAG: 3-dehydroquinate synthase [Erysipelotrichaceae bacterium]|nr:3-dehydroquinate synthase [Erysipelotrichaceae bacterium]
MKRITVSCSRRYDVIIGNDLIDHISSFLNDFNLGNNILVITDDNVSPLYSDIVLKDLNQNYQTSKYVLPNGESSKNIDHLYQILNHLSENHFHRNDTILALGGGVVTDISGLVAALYMRGINLVMVPTTLLGMVDASIGGKTAIDLNSGKNLVGTFYQPLTVICDVDIIRKLPKSIFKEGMAEVIKYNVIEDCPIISYINNDTFMEHLEEVIEYCISIKAKIVSEDEYERKGLRKLLNAGHTFAHALENISDYQISHGIAVGTGLVYEATLSEYLGLCDHDTVQQIRKAIQKYDLLIPLEYDLNHIVNHMKLDKKNEDANISFILPTTLGKCIERKLSIEEVKQAYQKIGVIL